MKNRWWLVDVIYCVNLVHIRTMHETLWLCIFIESNVKHKNEVDIQIQGSFTY